MSFVPTSEQLNVERPPHYSTQPEIALWKGRLASAFAKILDELRFPRESRHWLKGARDAFERQLVDNRPACVVISHEPCVGLMLGYLCDEAKVLWIAELGDPVCTTHTAR